MAAFTSIALGVAAAAALGSTVYQGVQQQREQRRALRAQEQAQAMAEMRMASTKRQNDLDYAQANRRAPDFTALLEAAQRRAQQGAASTLLTGGRGLRGFDLTMQRNPLLGD